MDDNSLFAMEPFFHDIPYAQKVGSTQVHLTLEEAIDEARRTHAPTSPSKCRLLYVAAGIKIFD